MTLEAAISKIKMHTRKIGAVYSRAGSSYDGAVLSDVIPYPFDAVINKYLVTEIEKGITAGRQMLDKVDCQLVFILQLATGQMLYVGSKID